MGWRTLTVLIAAAAALTVAATVWILLPRPPEYLEVRGLLVDVQSRGIEHVESVTLRTPDGTLHLFVASPEVMTNPEEPATASHLRQHLTGGIPVLIRYRSADGPSVAFRIVDADSP